VTQKERDKGEKKYENGAGRGRRGDYNAREEEESVQQVNMKMSFEWSILI
jgi:hypothetical protein